MESVQVEINLSFCTRKTFVAFLTRSKTESLHTLAANICQAHVDVRFFAAECQQISMSGSHLQPAHKKGT